MRKNRVTQRGMTLVELMIVIVVVALLASIAVPSYRNYIIRAQRTEAKTALLRIGAAEEKFYLQNSRYTTAVGAGGLNLEPLSENGHYTLNVMVDPLLGNQGFIATATPVAGSGQDSDTDCATFTLNHRGARDASPAGRDACWR